jgi:hypothetical protein
MEHSKLTDREIERLLLFFHKRVMQKLTLSEQVK